jgi:DNA-binding MarR family transcriptional regulator
MRAKLFGEGRLRPLDRNEKVRVQTLAYALSKPTEEGKHFGILTLKFVEVLKALLWGFHNATTGRCFPSYERIAEKAGCSPSTVGSAIKALEGAGLLTWVNRLIRVRKDGRVRVWRTSNAYIFNVPGSNTKFQPGTANQGTRTFLTCALPVPKRLDPRLQAAVDRLGAVFR